MLPSLLFFIVLAILSISPFGVQEADLGAKRVFPKDMYKNSERIFGRRLQPVYWKRAIRVVDNIQRISKSKQKKLFLYTKLEKTLRRKYARPVLAKLFGFIDEPQEAPLLALFLQANQRVRARCSSSVVIPDLFLFAALNNEGLIFADFSRSGELPPLNGYSAAGLDWFGREFKELVAAGLIKRDVKSLFSVRTEKNELGYLVQTAKFRNADILFEAFAATMAHRQLFFIKHCKQLKIKYIRLTHRERLFWTYYYFNAGPGVGFARLKKVATLGGMRDFYYERFQGGASKNALIVLTAMDWLLYSGSFDLKPDKKYWWSGGKGLPRMP